MAEMAALTEKGERQRRLVKSKEGWWSSSTGKWTTDNYGMRGREGVTFCGWACVEWSRAAMDLSASFTPLQREKGKRMGV
jgi:hypothetical protein